MARYMRSNLEQDIAAVNAAGKAKGRTTYLVVGARNGYTALDEYRKDGDRSVCLRTLDCNVPPRRLLEVAWNWAS